MGQDENDVPYPFGYKNDAKEPPEYKTWAAFIMSNYWFVAQW